MTPTAKSTLKQLVAAHAGYLMDKFRAGERLTDAEHTAIATHSLACELSEVADALGRIYMAIDQHRKAA